MPVHPIDPAVPAIVQLNSRSAALAARLRAALPGSERWAPDGTECPAEARFGRLETALQELFAAGRPILGVCEPAGILVRLLAPVLAHKTDEPPVLAIAEDGSAVVPLLGGHRGANRLAATVAAALEVAPAITTASDAAFGFALDEPPPGWRAAPANVHKSFATRLLAGEPARLVVEAGDPGWLQEGNLRFTADGAAAPLEIHLTHRAVSGGPARAVLHPVVLAVGVGCARDADPAQLFAHARRTLEAAGLAERAVACVASIDIKSDETAIHALAERLEVPARFFPSERLLAETNRLTTRSTAVFAATGCWGVAEGAALAVAGEAGRLIVPKQIGSQVTCAVAMAPAVIDPMTVGRARGSLTLVGLGPGDAGSRTRAAEAALRRATDIVGYSLYLELAGDLVPHKLLHPFALGEEETRCRTALELAAGGADVALLASGDPGIYAMASLVCELRARENNPAWDRIAFTVLPGITAMQAAAATVGAPLGHDFCAISLSDLLTPWPVIERRLEAAAAADFVIALYNPVSRTRRAGLARAIQVFCAHRSPRTPVVVARELGRADQAVRIVRLDQLTVDDADMLTVLIVGNRATAANGRGHGRGEMFTPRGYRDG